MTPNGAPTASKATAPAATPAAPTPLLALVKTATIPAVPRTKPTAPERMRRSLVSLMGTPGEGWSARFLDIANIFTGQTVGPCQFSIFRRTRQDWAARPPQRFLRRAQQRPGPDHVRQELIARVSLQMRRGPFSLWQQSDERVSLGERAALSVGPIFEGWQRQLQIEGSMPQEGVGSGLGDASEDFVHLLRSIGCTTSWQSPITAIYSRAVFFEATLSQRQPPNASASWVSRTLLPDGSRNSESMP